MSKILTHRERQKIEKRSPRLEDLKKFISVKRNCLKCGKIFKTTPNRMVTCKNCFESNSYYSP